MLKVSQRNPDAYAIELESGMHLVDAEKAGASARIITLIGPRPFCNAWNVVITYGPECDYYRVISEMSTTYLKHMVAWGHYEICDSYIIVPTIGGREAPEYAYSFGV